MNRMLLSVHPPNPQHARPLLDPHACLCLRARLEDPSPIINRMLFLDQHPCTFPTHHASCSLTRRGCAALLLQITTHALAHRAIDKIAL